MTASRALRLAPTIHRTIARDLSASEPFVPSPNGAWNQSETRPTLARPLAPVFLPGAQLCPFLEAEPHLPRHDRRLLPGEDSTVVGISPIRRMPYGH
jgi:hypothetical protein